MDRTGAAALLRGQADCPHAVRMRNAKWLWVVVVLGCSGAGREPVDGGAEPCPRINCSDAGSGAAQGEAVLIACGCQCERDGIETQGAAIKCTGVLADAKREIPSWQRWFAEHGACSAAAPCECVCGCQTYYLDAPGPCTLERLQEAAE